VQAYKCQILHEITETVWDIRVEFANTMMNETDDGDDDDDDDECFMARDIHISGKLPFNWSHKHAQLLLLGKGTAIGNLSACPRLPKR
jgi:hypothetical protein